MKIICPHCSAAYNIAEERVKKFGDHVIFPCPSCKGKIEIDLTKQQKNSTAPPSTSGSGGETTSDLLKKMILSKVNDLPPMPQVVQRARTVLADKNCSFSDIARVIETDQSIATRILKLANSAYYGVMGTVTSIQHASMILGIRTLNQLLEIACTSTLLTPKLDGYGMDSGELWQHSLEVAGCARAIAKKRSPEMSDDAFSAGLIHDCGKLILDKYIFERRGIFQTFLKDGSRTFLEAEKNILGFDHAQIAASVCEKWDIPKRLTNAIQYHHYPSLLRFNELAYVVHSADAIVHMSDDEADTDPTRTYKIDNEAVKLFNLDQKQISLFRKETRDYVDKTIHSI
jgi:putative nucleotidyltransferase with HDIG domain